MVSASVATYTSTLPQWVNTTNQFQHYYILNKTVLDLTSVDVPYKETVSQRWKNALALGLGMYQPALP
jgi:hypothetical protein